MFSGCCYVKYITFSHYIDCCCSSDTEDLPELVDADTSDTSRSDDERLGEDKMPGLVDLESQEETDDSCNSDGEVNNHCFVIALCLHIKDSYLICCFVCCLHCAICFDRVSCCISLSHHMVRITNIVSGGHNDNLNLCC